MSTRYTVVLAVAAGFLGGIASRYSTPAPVHAQAPAISQEIRAQKFVLVDENGVARGVFGIETNGNPEVEVTDSQGRRVWACGFYNWRAVASVLVDATVRGPKKPTLLPIKP